MGGWSDKIMVVVPVFGLVEDDALLHILVLKFELTLLDEFEYLGVAGDFADVLLAVVVYDEVVVVVALPEGRELELLHADEVLVAEAELVLDGGVELVEVAGTPAVLVVGRVQLDLLAADVELVGVVQGDEVDGHDLVPVPEEDGVDEAGLLVLADGLLAVLDLEGPNLSGEGGTSFLFFLRLTMNSLTESVVVSFSPWRMATVFLLQMMRMWRERL